MAVRASACNDFKKDFYKLMVNSVFGKTMERVNHHQDMQFATTEDHLNCLECKPNWVYFGNDLSMVELSCTQDKEFKPIYSGQAILDISKMLLYEFIMVMWFPSMDLDSSSCIAT